MFSRLVAIARYTPGWPWENRMSRILRFSGKISFPFVPGVKVTLLSFKTRSWLQEEASILKVSPEILNPLKSRHCIIEIIRFVNKNFIFTGSVRRVANGLKSTFLNKNRSKDNLYHHWQTRETRIKSLKERKLKILKTSSSCRVNTGAETLWPLTLVCSVPAWVCVRFPFKPTTLKTMEMTLDNGNMFRFENGYHPQSSSCAYDKSKSLYYFLKTKIT